ncbi:hypothetical protein [Thauera sp. SDU_THAU2]|uniref:hypothetical protein n=1 Tax=Thauera sp. SDU_THAU2 TaxID=3136633 RepID=UPI00311E17D5
MLDIRKAVALGAKYLAIFEDADRNTGDVLARHFCLNIVVDGIGVSRTQPDACKRNGCKAAAASRTSRTQGNKTKFLHGIAVLC